MQDSGSLAVFKVTARDQGHHKGPPGAFVTYRINDEIGLFDIQIRTDYGWLVGCFGFNGPLRQYFSLYRAVSQREGERGKKG